MSLLWIVLLGFAVLAASQIGQGTNNIAALAAWFFFLGAIVLYFCPIIVAASRKHAKMLAISAVNLFLGWTLIGWVVALAWAYSEPRVESGTRKKSELPKSAELPVVGSDPDGTRLCPYCAEEVKVRAVKCKHCGSDISLGRA